MAAIITEKFRQHNAEQFYESFSEASKSTYSAIMSLEEFKTVNELFTALS